MGVKFQNLEDWKALCEVRYYRKQFISLSSRTDTNNINSPDIWWKKFFLLVVISIADFISVSHQE